MNHEYASMKTPSHLFNLVILLVPWSAALLPTPSESGGDAKRTPAFPGAEGAGKWARGGRGGKVIAVTNLNDAGPGSLRAAIETPGPRTVIFRVSGTIELTKPLRVAHPYLTIAGQTAPGDGICLKGRELQIGNTHDVVIRYLRCRPGDKTSKPGDLDAISISDAKDVIIDHCSATWSTDECLSVTRDSDRVTVQHCLIAEGLTKHSYGSIIASYRGVDLVPAQPLREQHVPQPAARRLPVREGTRERPRAAHRLPPQRDLQLELRPRLHRHGRRREQPERIAMNYVGNYLKPGPDTAAADRAKAFTIFKGGTAELFLDGNQFDPPLPITLSVGTADGAPRQHARPARQADSVRTAGGKADRQGRLRARAGRRRRGETQRGMPWTPPSSPACATARGGRS